MTADKEKRIPVAFWQQTYGTRRVREIEQLLREAGCQVSSTRNAVRACNVPESVYARCQQIWEGEPR